MTLQETFQIETAAIAKYASELANAFNAAPNPTADQKKRALDCIAAYARARMQRLEPFLDAIEMELSAKSFANLVAAKAKASGGADKSKIRSAALDEAMTENPAGYHFWRQTGCKHPILFI
jgi:hypothetical protein